MRNNQPVTQRERTFSTKQRLISTTNLKGQITYCNEAFIEISGFSREELQHSPHNIVRHPDVPSAVFAHLWAALKEGRPWMGIVKNRSKNGDHYWINAYVTPVTENGRIVGYESVRIKPSAEQIQRTEALYRRINAGKPAIPSRDHWLSALQALLPFILLGPAGYLFGHWMDSSRGFILAALLSVPLGLVGIAWQNRGIKRLLGIAEQITSDPLVAQMYTDSRGAEARLEMAMLSQEARLKTCLTRLQDTAEQLTQQAVEADRLAHCSSVGLERQREETDQVATAVNEMATTTLEVANNVARTAIASQEAKRLSSVGRDVAAQTREAIERLSQSVGNTGETVTRLAHDSNKIWGVVAVIKSIAEQTNLLALNAAIEAARAGEMGRGFAVVADEVRSLAQSTAEATEQIHGLISKLQSTAEEAVMAMEVGCEQAAEGVERVLEADRALAGISDAVANITDMTTYISAAAEQQSSVADNINQSISTIVQLAEQTASEAHSTARLSETLTNTAKGQYALVERFNR